MVRPPLLLAALIALPAAAAPAGKDPVVGRWLSPSKLGTLVIEFRADGTVRTDASALAGAVKKQGLPPPIVASVKDGATRSRIVWTRQKQGLYKLVGSYPGRRTKGPFYWKLAGNRLLEADATGKPTGKGTLTRAR